MAKPTEEYIRAGFLRQFARMSADRRAGTIEALTVLHEGRMAEDEKPPAEAEPPNLLDALQAAVMKSSQATELQSE